MKLLFISSGNVAAGISPIVKNQGESLRLQNIEIEFFTVKGKEIIGYMKNIRILKKHLKNHKYDLFHAHYSLSAFIASLAGCRPLIVSLMGSDVNEKGLYRFLIRFFAFFFWEKVIVKSDDMAQKIFPVKNIIVPNGVDISVFKELNIKKAKIQTEFAEGINILFVANPERPEKNYQLAKDAVDLIQNKSIILHKVYGKPTRELVWYYNAADLLLMSSLWEGSPNAIKEAMACNCPVVSTDVGDVKWLFGKTEGYYITSFEPKDVAEKIKKAINFGKRTKGRERIMELGLDSETIAGKLVNVYENVLKRN